MHGALFTTPVPISLLAPGDKRCNICYEAYAEPPPYGSTHKIKGGEWAVRVELVADISGTKQCCGHIFGRRCLEAHLRSSGPWRRQCPLCRQAWFHEYQRPVRGVPRAPPMRPQRRSERIVRLRSSALNSERRNRSRSPQRETARAHARQRMSSSEPIQFTERLHRHLKIEEGSDEVGRTLEEVEQALGEFYGRPGLSED